VSAESEQLIVRQIAAWFASRSVSTEKLFSPELAPPVTVEQILTAFWAKPLSDAVQQWIISAVNHVVARRAELLPPISAEGPRGEGRFVVMHTWLTDGIELGLETGVVDRLDIPAWEFWVRAEADPQGCIIHAWIPAAFVADMEHVTRLCPLEALEWRDRERGDWPSD
jgi:hypothetical protein